MAEVRARVAELIATWEEWGQESLRLQLLTERPLAQAVPAVKAVLQELQDKVGYPPDIAADEVAVFPEGPVILVEFCDYRDVLVSWLAELTAGLGENGLNGELRVFEPDSSAEWLRDEEIVATTLAAALPVDLEAIVTDVSGPSRVAPYWYGTEPATTLAVASLVEWCIASASDLNPVSFRHAMPEQDVDAGQVLDLVLLALRQRTVGSVTVTCGHSAEDFRFISFDSLGRFTAAGADGAAGGVQQALALAGLLAPLAPQLENALARRAVAGWWWSHVVNPPVLRPSPPFLGKDLGASSLSEFRHLMSGRVFDAYGIQLLTDAHLANAHDLTGWDVESVTPGRHVVRAPDLDPWYAGDQPDPAVLEQARADFGEMILSAAVAAAEPRPW